jgi:hypothetical protein
MASGLFDRGGGERDTNPGSVRQFPGDMDRYTKDLWT